MPPFRPSRRLLQSAISSSSKAASNPRSALASRIAVASARNATLFPVITECPAATCACQPMPAGLDIDNSSTISNNIVPYNSHILIATGQSDWTSRIEDAHKDPSTQPWGQLISHLKTAFGRKGQYHSDTLNVLITASSLPTTPAAGRTVLLFPAHEELSISTPSLTTEANDDSELESLTSYLATRSSSTDAAALTASIKSTPLTHPTILICSHNSRDTRCGVLGPILHSEFSNAVAACGEQDIRVAMVSHVGGHKWAGNVIIYIPPGWKVGASSQGTRDNVSPLAHKAVWYGRVEPKHVEGIMKQTIMGGKVIGELCRGVVDDRGQLIRI